MSWNETTVDMRQEEVAIVFHLQVIMHNILSEQSVRNIRDKHEYFYTEGTFEVQVGCYREFFASLIALWKQI